MTQEEIDELLANMYVGVSGCNHEFVTYVGLTETYEYCIRCDEKRIKGDA
jgi:hypothetical protein